MIAISGNSALSAHGMASGKSSAAAANLRNARPRCRAPGKLLRPAIRRRQCHPLWRAACKDPPRLAAGRFARKGAIADQHPIWSTPSRTRAAACSGVWTSRIGDFGSHQHHALREPRSPGLICSKAISGLVACRRAPPHPPSCSPRAGCRLA
jgi:hypothetical protein